MKNQNTALILGFMILGACSSKEPAKKPIIYPANSPEVSTTNPKETSILAKQVASEQGSNFVSELKFKKGQAQLQEADKKNIREVFEKAQKTGKVKEVQLISWADKDFPSKDKKELDADQKDLVEKRNDSLEKYVSSLNKDLDVKKISMAERAGTFERFTAADEAEVKESLNTKDAPGKTGEAMVIFLLKK